MISTGNDIVALNAVNITRTKQPRFYSKILSATEITLYESTPEISEIPLEIFVWLLWSVKEAAFKYWQRLNPALVFTPVKFEVISLTSPHNKTTLHVINEQITGIGIDCLTMCKGVITHNSGALHFSSIITPDFIHTIVNISESFENTHWAIKYISDVSQENQSAVVRTLLLEKLKIILNDDDIRIEKTESGCPILLKKDTIIDIPISLAHHENWVAYSFQL
jgi:phosphopantetheinyl transferase (holo-ACP synthase)